MSNLRIEDLAPNEFEAMLENMLSESFDKVTPVQFFGALAAQGFGKVGWPGLKGSGKPRQS